MPNCAYIYLSVCLSIYLPVCLSVYLSTYLAIYLSTYLSVSIYICVCVRLFIYYMSCIYGVLSQPTGVESKQPSNIAQGGME